MNADHLSRAHIIKFHRDSIKSFGIESKEALGWKNKETQQARFKALTESEDLTDKTILDTGCGNGDLLQFLDGNNVRCHYTGIDQMKEFIELAGKKYESHKHASFLFGDFWTADLDTYDYVFASGSLSYYNADPNFIYKMIFRLYSLSTKGFAFNLRESVELANSGLVAYDKRKMIHYCCKICPHVTLKDDYLPGDYTLALYK